MGALTHAHIVTRRSTDIPLRHVADTPLIPSAVQYGDPADSLCVTCMVIPCALRFIPSHPCPFLSHAESMLCL